MNVITIIMVVFSILGAADRIFGSRFGLGKEFERGFMLLGTMALSMIGMIVISPWIADILAPVFDIVQKISGIDPSIIPASLFANDMGGAPLSVEVAHNSEVGLFNALVVSSMMGCTISFTILHGSVHSGTRSGSRTVFVLENIPDVAKVHALLMTRNQL